MLANWLQKVGHRRSKLHHERVIIFCMNPNLARVARLSTMKGLGANNVVQQAGYRRLEYPDLVPASRHIRSREPLREHITPDYTFAQMNT